MPSVGIDLGTTRTSVAIYLNNKIVMIPQEGGEKFLPCYVSFTSIGRLIGESAAAHSLVDPENTVYSMKRFIGRRFNDPFLQRDMKLLTFKLENNNGNPKISVVYKEERMLIDPEEISAMILKRAKVNAEIFLGQRVTNAVITVPAYFNDSQRQATKDAGSIAGLNVIGILNEPTAAAIAYELNRTSQDEKNILIYDLGSGMFDTSVLKYQGHGFEVKAIEGDTHLGGIDFDNAMVDHCADIFLNEHGKDIRKSFIATRRLRIACHHAKHELSSKEETVIAVSALLDGTDFEATVSRSQFEEMCDPLFQKTIEFVEKVLHESHLDKEDIDDVVLVGGCTKIPKIQSLVSNFFDGKFICKSINPDEAVAYGAAIRAAILTGFGGEKMQDLFFADVIPLSIGIETTGGAMSVVIPRNTSIPCEKTYTVTTSTDNETDVTVLIFQGERAMTADNNLLGKLELSGFPPSPLGVPQIELTFRVDSNGILTVLAEEEKLSMVSRRITIELDKGRLSPIDIQRMLKEAEEREQEDMAEKDKIRLRKAIEAYASSMNSAAFSDSQGILSDHQKLQIQDICNETCKWLKDNPGLDEEALIEVRRSIITRLQPYAKMLEHSALPPDIGLLPS